jgi:3-hydroxyisobutyrate dehydrogenase
MSERAADRSDQRALTPPACVLVVGLGNMGRPMSARLMGAGFRVIGFDVASAACEQFTSETGGAVAPSLAAAADADAVVTILPNGAIVRKALDEMRPHLRQGTLIVEMSSSDPIGTRELGKELVAAGFGFVDAPVSGGVRRAVDGTLAIMAGGDDRTIDRAEPLLKAMGRAIFRTGPIGSGHAVKALNNYVSGAGLVAALEAMYVGKMFGVQPETLVDVLNASTGKNNSTEVKLKQYVISERYDSGFFLGLMAKDIRTAQHLAERLGVPMTLGDKCASLWDEAAERLGEKADHTAINQFLTRPR